MVTPVLRFSGKSANQASLHSFWDFGVFASPPFLFWENFSGFFQAPHVSTRFESKRGVQRPPPAPARRLRAGGRTPRPLGASEPKSLGSAPFTRGSSPCVRLLDNHRYKGFYLKKSFCPRLAPVLTMARGLFCILAKPARISLCVWRSPVRMFPSLSGFN